MRPYCEPLPYLSSGLAGGGLASAPSNVPLSH
jgi:hypothetical protein